MGKKLLIAVVASIGCWPAAGQHFASAAYAPPAPLESLPIARVAPAPVAAATLPTIRLETKRSPSNASREFTVVITRINESRSSAIDSMYDVVVTPFASSVRVPMASVAGGRLQLSGYHCLASSENFQMGLPGGGVLPAWGIGTQSHPVILVPQNNESGGFNVTFTLHANDTATLRIHPLEAVNHAVNFLCGI